MAKLMQNQDILVVIFFEEDLLLRIIEHENPLYVTLKSDGIMISRLLINLGFSIHLMSLKILSGLPL